MISIKNFTVAGFEKLHIGVAILVFFIATSALKSNSSNSLKLELIFDLQNCSQPTANRYNNITDMVKREV